MKEKYLIPSSIVRELDKYIIGQDTERRAVVCREIAIAEITFRSGLQQYVCKEHLEEMLKEGNCE